MPFVRCKIVLLSIKKLLSCLRTANLFNTTSNNPSDTFICQQKSFEINTKNITLKPKCHFKEKKNIT